MKLIFRGYKIDFLFIDVILLNHNICTFTL